MTTYNIILNIITIICEKTEHKYLLNEQSHLKPRMIFLQFNIEFIKIESEGVSRYKELSVGVLTKF